MLILAGCTLTPEQEAWNRQHHVGELPWTSQTGPALASPFNDKNWADPHPQSDSNDQQRAAYEANQRQQREELDNRNAGTGPSFTDGMNCTTTTSNSGSANSATTTSNTTCH